MATALAINPARPHASKSWSAGKRTSEVDLHVARRLLAARKMAGLSQEAAAEVIGVTFQQLQKYERGANRVSAGRLAALAMAYKLPVAWFFEGIGTAKMPANDIGTRLLGTNYGADIANLFVAIRDPSRRMLLCQIAREFSGAAQ